jgi:hypothetical protein
MNDLTNAEIHVVTLKYTNSSGSFGNLPKSGLIVDHAIFGKLRVIRSDPMTKFTDGGASPFEAHVKCIPVGSMMY